MSIRRALSEPRLLARQERSRDDVELAAVLAVVQIEAKDEAPQRS
jgi:hypothetical protein